MRANLLAAVADFAILLDANYVVLLLRAQPGEGPWWVTDWAGTDRICLEHRIYADVYQSLDTGPIEPRS